jgi:hypothetical protein
MAGGGAELGERRGGRQKGTPNKATAEVPNIAPQDAPAAVSLPGPRTQARIQAAKQQTKARSIRPEVKLTSHEGQQVQIDSAHADGEGHSFHLLDAFGTSSPPFAEAMLGQLAGVVRTRSDSVDEGSLNAGLAAVDGIAPQNEAEAMLAVQMAGTHSVAMEMLRKAKFATSIPALQEYGNLATKLLRTYTTQMECLAKVRRRGEQKVTVEHVHVYPGGQAVVGNITQTGNREGVGAESDQQSHAPTRSTDFSALAYAPGASVWSHDPLREAVSVSCGKGPEPMPDARRDQRRRARGPG